VIKGSLKTAATPILERVVLLCIYMYKQTFNNEDIKKGVKGQTSKLIVGCQAKNLSGCGALGGGISVAGGSSSKIAVLAARRSPGSFFVIVVNASAATAEATSGPTMAARNATYKEN
jgi:hypothetical protein